MKKLKLYEYFLYTGIILFTIFLDQLTKWLAVKFLEPIKEGVPVIEGIFHLTYKENEGAAFGILADHRWVFMTISVFAIGALLFYLFAGLAENKLYAVSVAMIIGGGIGNMIDRIALGYVVDFMDFTGIGFPGIFNTADSFVCVGAGILLLALILDIVKESKKLKKEKETKEGK